MTKTDAELLADLQKAQRDWLDSVVDEIILESLPSADRAYLLAAAASFDRWAAGASGSERTTCRLIAAALRERAMPSVRVH